MIGDSETRRKKNSGADVCTWIDRKVRKLQFLSVDQYILDSEDRSDQAPAEKLLSGTRMTNAECGVQLRRRVQILSLGQVTNSDVRGPS